MTDLSDRIEGAQDELRNVATTTKSEISNIKGEVQERCVTSMAPTFCIQSQFHLSEFRFGSSKGVTLVLGDI